MLQAEHPADPAAHEVIESIVSLTEQRDQRSLEHSLFTSLQEMLEPRDCWLISLDGEDGAPRAVAGDASLLPGDILDIVKGGPRDFDIRFTQVGGKEYLLASTLSAEGEHTRLLVIARGYWDDDNLRLAQGMIKVYQNFVSILRDSEKDTLTGLLNRRKLESKLNDLLAASLRGRRYRDLNHSDFLAVFDLDHFKRVNDNHGHLIGDETLLSFANILRQTLRGDDLIFRYGGEEFVVLLQELSSEQAAYVLERVRKNAEKHRFPQVGQVTVSGGFTVLKPGATPPRVIEEADRALYYAKEHGRNQIRNFQALVNTGELSLQEEQGSVELF
jgi:diguanylate cyclase (GGDEF)-like protein